MTDEEAEAFLDSDLSDLDFSQFKSGRVRFEEGSRVQAEIVSGMNAVRERAMERLRGLLLDALGEHDAQVYLFGSLARGDIRHASDIDIAILPGKEFPPVFFSRLAETIEENTILYEVDLIELRKVSPAFRDEVVRSGIKWRD